ncbi:MAG: PcfJ domain-containing protein [Mangrovibacterium sp.]
MKGKKRTSEQSAYYAIITTCEEFQVVRTFWTSKTCKVGKEPRIVMSEVVQNWIAPTGRHEVIATTVNGGYGYLDNWILGNMEIRSNPAQQKYAINPYRIYPKMRVIKNIKRNGFKSGFHAITPVSLFRFILKDSKAETLLKAGQYAMLRSFIERHSYIDWDGGYWPSLKICIRNKYLIKDPSTWIDHIRGLRELGMDVFNSKYVCPVDLDADHAKLNERIRRKRELKQKEEEKKRIKEEEEGYKKKAKFLGFEFTYDEIKIVALNSVQEFYDEGQALHHCVYTGGYYKKPHSLILSARIDEKPIETIEVSLKSFEIVQARGLQNYNSPYHDQIVSLVKDNMNKIKKIAKSKKKQHETVLDN